MESIIVIVFQIEVYVKFYHAVNVNTGSLFEQNIIVLCLQCFVLRFAKNSQLVHIQKILKASYYIDSFGHVASIIFNFICIKGYTLMSDKNNFQFSNENNH